MQTQKAGKFSLRTFVYIFGNGLRFNVLSKEELRKLLCVETTKEQARRIRRGFAECFRVLRPGGTLIFKWNELAVPVREILALTPERPLYGHKSGKASKTHWIAFLKPNDNAHSS